MQSWAHSTAGEENQWYFLGKIHLHISGQEAFALLLFTIHRVVN